MDSHCWIDFLVVGILKPNLLINPYKLWIKLGNLKFINSHVILGIVFFIVLFPISLVMRLFGYDPLNKRSKRLKTFKIDNSKHKTDLKRILNGSFFDLIIDIWDFLKGGENIGLHL